ncbi:hypothetical protein BJX96DRAFT_161117 [Aspergillus floccosus]
MWRALIILSLFLTQGAVAPDCSSHDVETNNVGQCTCSGGGDTCNTQCDAGQSSSGCPGTVIQSQLFLDDCKGHCTSDTNHRCQSCWIWFNALCSCYKNGGCAQSSQTPPFWIQLNGNLLTTNEPIPSILELQQHPSLSRFGWDFGQTVTNPDSQALVINSAHSITENQIHMHTCPKNNDMVRALTALSTNPGPAAFGTLTSIPLPGPAGVEPVWCRVSQQKNTAVDGKTVSDDINQIMGSRCKFYVGAAVVRDTNGYTWDCITADSKSTEYGRFCA